MLTILFTSILNPIIHINFTIKRHLNTIKISELNHLFNYLITNFKFHGILPLRLNQFNDIWYR